MSTNYAIGAMAEDRIARQLKNLGASEILKGNHNAIPDIQFTFKGIKVYAELKTILTPHGGKEPRNGVGKMLLTEFDAMERLPDDGIKILVIELRPFSGPGRVYFVIPWASIRSLFEKPAAMKSLTFWWLMQNSTRLDQWRPAQ